MKKTTLLVFSLLCTLLSFAQGTLNGTVKDAETGLPLEGASVFAQNTTRGTLSDKEGAFKLYLERGGYEIVISFTGYLSRTINLAEVTGDREFTIELQKGDNTLGEVIIKNTNEVADGWEKHGQFFLANFIGASPNADSCTLLNPEALKFLYYKRNDRLKVLATEPLRIENRALGYNMRYELDSFVHHFQTDLNSYRGNCLYLPMEGDANQQAAWEKARKEAYYGSRLHFLRAYYDSTLVKEGFTVDLFSPSSSTKFSRLRNPYDTAFYYFDDSTANAELFFPDKASITYTKKAPEKRYLEKNKLPLNVPVQISYVDIAETILIKPNGYFTDQKSWINQGYWSWRNLADQLPYDYEPPANEKVNASGSR
ncbi:carboxypeptidase-like regulatory domain-containing protein [Flavisolibacter sp. BT320]|nr:carboxypeptidase-like regulatory domain-containing protein [Flavisolibacter longurius]